jgi:hypothetical protein
MSPFKYVTANFENSVNYPYNVIVVVLLVSGDKPLFIINRHWISSLQGVMLFYARLLHTGSSNWILHNKGVRSSSDNPPSFLSSLAET